MRIRSCVISLCVFSLGIFLTACAHDAARARAASDWVQTELFFGVAAKSADAALVTQREQRWQTFLDKEVTPRFPEGLSVFDVSGQWLSPKKGTISYEHSKALLILYHDTSQHRADIEAIRGAWKALTSDESVLRIDQTVDVSF
jgi:hypothetical protein